MAGSAGLAGIPNVLIDPTPDVEILEFNLAGTKLAVRPSCHNDHYWQVYFDTNKAISETGAANNWPVPAPHQVFLQPAVAAPVAAAARLGTPEAG